MILAAHDIHLSLPEANTPLLDHISVEFPENAITAVCGCNGCGKTTLLKALCAILPVNSGKITLDEREITTFSRLELARKIAFMPQNPQGGGNFTVAELAAMGRFAFAGSKAENNRVIGEVLDITGLRELRDRRIATLSGGERQRAFLALALSQTPEVLLLDEPFSALDPAAGKELSELLIQMKQLRKMSVIIVRHDLNHALRHSDFIVGMRRGRVEFILPPETAAPRLPELFALPPTAVFEAPDGKPALI